MKYEKSHKHLRFSADLELASPRLWLRLGEVQSKCEHVAGVPLSAKLAKELHQLYLEKGAQATTAIEGNTLSDDEVRRHLRGELELPPSKEYLGREVDNIVAACNSIADDLFRQRTEGLSVSLIKEFNRLVLQDLPLGEDVVPGEIRHHAVVAGRYEGAPAEDCEYLLNRLCEWMNQERDRASAGDEIMHAVIRAVLTHLYMVWIHPFGDGNGRTARLMEFAILVDAGVPSPAAHLLSNHYNKTRHQYYVELDSASRSGGEVVSFLQYAVQGLLDGLKEHLDLIRKYQWQIIWRDYVYRSFDEESMNASAEVRRRRRNLVLALSESDDFLPVRMIPFLEIYGKKTQRTVSRDLNALKKAGLVEIGKKGVRARKETILAFLPRQKTE